MRSTEGSHASSSEPAYGIGVSSPDRKSTRLNSSHSQISYAVFCLKKKIPCSFTQREIPDKVSINSPLLRIRSYVFVRAGRGQQVAPSYMPSAVRAARPSELLSNG